MNKVLLLFFIILLVNYINAKKERTDINLKFMLKNSLQHWLSFTLIGIILLESAFLMVSDSFKDNDTFYFGIGCIIFFGILQIIILFFIKNILGNVITLIAIGYASYFSILALMDVVNTKFMYSAGLWVLFEGISFIYSIINLIKEVREEKIYSY